MNKTIFFTRFCLLNALIFVLVSGCAEYRLGTTLPAKLRDVYVVPIRNESGQPQVDLEVWHALNAEIQREGTMKLSSEGRASTKLEVVIVGYDLEPVRYNRDNTKLPDEYRMVLRAHVVFTNLKEPNPSKAIIMDGVIEGDETFLRGTDTITARQRCLPAAGKKLANRIVEDCISVW